MKKTEETNLIEIKKGKEEYQKIVKGAQEIAERKSQETIEKTKTKTQEIVDSAKQEIRSEKEKSVEEAKKEITDIAIQIAKKIVGNNLDGEKQKEIANDILRKI